MANWHTGITSSIDSIIFDLDGTLWDATGTVAKAWQAAANKVDFIKEPITQAMVRSITGMPYDAIYIKLFPYLINEQRAILMDLCSEEELAFMQAEGGYLYPDLEETLTYLKEKYPLFIVSNCQSGYIEAFLERHQLHRFFTDIECFGNTLKSKGENIKAIMERNQLKHPVYVGDTMGDYSASKSNNLPFIATTFGFGVVETPDASIDYFRELKDLL